MRFRHTRYLILLIIFIVTAVNYADRATLSIAGTEVAKELQLSAVSMGYIFSAFGWAYLLMQIPGGWLLDKFGSKKVYTYSLFFWSLFTFLQGFVDMFPLAWAGISMFFMRFMLGFSEAPSFPANARIVAAWFPTKERGTASAIFNSAQYFSLALFSHHSRRTPVLSPPGSRRKNVVLPPPSLTRRNISRWRSFRLCLAG